MTDKQLFYATAGKCVSSWVEIDSPEHYTAHALYGFLDCKEYVKIEIRCGKEYAEVYGQILNSELNERIEVKKRLSPLQVEKKRLSDIARDLLFSVLRNDNRIENLVYIIHNRAEKLLAA